MSSRFLFVVVLCTWLTTAQAQNSAPQKNTRQIRQNCAAVSSTTCDVAHTLGRGINLGNMLDAPREGDWGVRLLPAYIDIVGIKFNTVRLPVRWSNNAVPSADATLDEFFAKRVEKVVDALLAQGIYVILDFHHYSQIHGDKLHRNEFEVAPDVLEARFLNIWRQISIRYKNHPQKLLFELLNEPHGKLNGKPWNDLARKSLAIIRESNPTRTVLIGPTYWNNVKHLDQLHVPQDKNVIIAIHSYEPFNFTHQGVSYLPIPLPIGKKCCDDQQKKQITDIATNAEMWNKKYGYPLHLGEFGSTDAGDEASRVQYIRLMRSEFESRGIGWAYWDFATSFGVFSSKKMTWIEPLRAALLE